MQSALLLAATLVIAISGLVYELLAGTLSSYLLGDSVYQFSIVIGLFMTAMGVGAFVSRYVGQAVERAFVLAQIATGVAGGTSALVLFYAFAYLDNYVPFLFAMCLLVGALIGLEIPLIIRILGRHMELKLNVSSVLTADYLGALGAALLFPLVLLPQLGLVSAGLVFGLLNIGVAVLALVLFHDRLHYQGLALATGAAALLLAVLLWHAERLVGMFETRLFDQEIIFARTTPYQRIVVTRDADRVRLFLNGSLQFDSLDEYRYHESLVHPAMGLARRQDRVLVLGGGDGLALREILRHPAVEHVDVVDIDPVMTRLFTENPLLQRFNGGSLRAPEVQVHNMDAWKYLEDHAGYYDVVIIDLPDPHGPGLSKLYSVSFYRLLATRLAADGVVATQATSPLYSRSAYWCIEKTLAATPARHGGSWHTLPYHVYVPSLGDWGFVLAAHHTLDWGRVTLPQGLRFLDAETLPALTQFAPDIGPLEVQINTLQSHVLLGYYEKGWQRWFP